MTRDPVFLVLTILGMGLVTFGIRLLPFELFGRIRLPVWAYQAMRYIPIAILTAIIFPEVFMPGGRLSVGLDNTRMLAALIASGVAWRTRNVLATVAVGMATLWALQMLLA